MSQVLAPMSQVLAPTSPAADSLRLLNGFVLSRAGTEVVVTSGCQRLVALLAVNGPSGRTVTAGTLWPDVPDARASGNLRTSLWRLNRQWPGLVQCDEQSLSLTRQISLDTVELTLRARAVADMSAALEPGERYCALIDAGELLPGWYDDWVILARERLRLLRLHALELLSERLLRAGQVVWAMESAMASVRAEPLRESAHHAVLAVHVACGNADEARRYYDQVSRMLRAELDVEPSERLRRLALQAARRRPGVPQQRPGAGARAAYEWGPTPSARGPLA
jgi:DNA-binding SARP family transcriptional activator